MLPSLQLTESEYQIVQDIMAVGYGELYNIRASTETETPIRFSPTLKIQKFLLDLRTIRLVHKLIIHDHEPVMAEYNGVTGNGHRYRKKIKY